MKKDKKTILTKKEIDTITSTYKKKAFYQNIFTCKIFLWTIF